MKLFLLLSAFVVCFLAADGQNTQSILKSMKIQTMGNSQRMQSNFGTPTLVTATSVGPVWVYFYPDRTIYNGQVDFYVKKLFEGPVTVFAISNTPSYIGVSDPSIMKVLEGNEEESVIRLTTNKRTLFSFYAVSGIVNPKPEAVEYYFPIARGKQTAVNVLRNHDKPDNYILTANPGDTIYAPQQGQVVAVVASGDQIRIEVCGRDGVYTSITAATKDIFVDVGDHVDPSAPLAVMAGDALDMAVYFKSWTGGTTLSDKIQSWSMARNHYDTQITIPILTEKSYEPLFLTTTGSVKLDSRKTYNPSKP